MQSPSYLNPDITMVQPGVAELEPHYFRPITPVAIQPYVSNTPFMRGDGVRPVMMKSKKMKRKLGSMLSGAHYSGACTSCQSVVPTLGYGAGGEWLKGLGGRVAQALNQVLTPEQQQNLKAGFIAEKTAKLCDGDKLPEWLRGTVCPDLTGEDTATPQLTVNPMLYVLGGSVVVLMGAVVYLAVRR